MIVNCLQCRRQLNLSGSLGAFKCPFCGYYAQVNGYMQSGVGMAPTTSIYNGQPMQSPGVMYTTVPVPSPVGTQPMYQQPQQYVVDPIMSTFQSATSMTGRMNVSSLQTALRTLGITLSGEICNQMFLRHDVDNSGVINYEEFRAIYDEVNQWVSVFNKFDDDRSGKMEYNEFLSAMGVLNFPISTDLLKKFFDKIDNLHNHFIDLNGFIKAVSIVQIIQLKMSMNDVNNTGRVTLDLNGVVDMIVDLPL